MSTRHDGVSCDACMKNSFRLRRYKCLICYDYDLCGSCYDSRRETNNHSTSHPMQCLLTKGDYETFYSGEGYIADSAFSLTCPLCNQMGLSESGLIEHVTGEHPDGEVEVICPICASHQDGHPNRQTFELARHLALDHRSGISDNQSGHGDDAAGLSHPTMLFSRIVAGGGSSGGPTGHLRHLRRAGRPAASNSSGPGQNAATTSATTATGARLGRRNLSSFAAALASAGGGATSENGSNSVDPIADLLSQLNSVRSRAAAASVSSQLAQLELQLQSTRAQIEQAMPAASRRAARTAAPGGSLDQLIYLTGGDVVPNSSNDSKLGSEADETANGLPGGTLLEEAAAVLIDCELAEQFPKGQPGFLFRVMRQEEERQKVSEDETFNRAGFIQELVLASLMETPSDKVHDS